MPAELIGTVDLGVLETMGNMAVAMIISAIPRAYLFRFEFSLGSLSKLTIYGVLLFDIRLPVDLSNKDTNTLTWQHDQCCPTSNMPICCAD